MAAPLFRERIMIFTVTDDIRDALWQVVLPRGARVCPAVLEDLFLEESINRVQLGGTWFRLSIDELGFSIEAETAEQAAAY
jgi:hypothetical protein